MIRVYSPRRSICRAVLNLSVLENRITPVAGQLDSTFGNGGTVITPFANAFSNDFARAVAVDSQGRVVVAGYTNNGSNEDFAVVRYTSAGALDTSFGETGNVRIDFSISDDKAYGVTVDSQDRIIVVGTTKNGSNYNFAITRVTSYGTLDSSFDDDGKQIISFGTNTNEANAVAVDSQDRVVVGGRLYTGFTDSMVIARLTSAGTLDPSFDSDGKQTVSFGGSFSSGINSVAVDSLDRVIIAGATSKGSASVFAVGRLTATGSLDASFDTDGKQTVAFGTTNDGAHGVAVDSLNRVVVGGYTHNGSNYDFAIARLTAAGTLDASFDTDGKQTIDFFGAADTGRGVAVDLMDRVIIGGYAQNGTTYQFAGARLTAGGVLDTDFDVDGKQAIAFGTASAFAYGVAVDGVDQVVIAGQASNGTNNDFSVVRLTTQGTLDAGFDSDGKQMSELRAVSNASVGDVAVDSMGRTIVAGSILTGARREFAITRYTTSGALDSSFGGTGSVFISIGTGNDIGTCVAIDSLGRVVVAGYSHNGTNNDFAVVRLTSTGMLDISFDSDGKKTFAFGTANDFAYDVAVDSLDRIVVVGRANFSFNDDFAVARLTNTGAFDSSFDSDGKKTIPFGTSNDVAFGVAIDSLGRVVVAGSASFGANYDFAVTRLTTTGQFDVGFDADGKQTVAIGASDDEVYGVGIDSLDRVLMAGYSYTGSRYQFAVARLNSGGTLDFSFDADGKQTIDFGTADDIGYNVAIDSFDRMVIVGASSNGTKDDFAIARLTTAGALDSSFDSDGRQKVAFGTSTASPAGVAVDDVGRLIVAGVTNTNGLQVAVARLTGDATSAVVQVNDGSAQRSTVTSLQITFSEPVLFPNGINGAFQLLRTGPDMPTGSVNLQFVHSGASVTVTFNDPTFAPAVGKSLMDGNYQLTLVADQIQSAFGYLDGNGDGVPGDNLVTNFHRLFGDANGDRGVTAADFNSFRLVYGSAGPSFFDVDGDNQVTAADFNAFRLQYGMNLAP